MIHLSMKQIRFVKTCLIFSIGITFLNCSHHISTQCLTDKVDQEAAKGNPMIRVGDSVIHQGQIDIISEIMPGFKAGWNDPEGKANMINLMIEQELFLQKAQKQNLLNNNDRLQKNLWLQVRNYQAGTYLLQEVDERAKAQYEKDKDRLYTQLEIRDILIAYKKNSAENLTDEEKNQAMKRAHDIRKKLNSTNFASIASETTDNPVAKINGGHIGAISKIDQRVRFLGWEPLVNQAFSMKKGQVSQPIATHEGVHIIQVVSNRQIQAFEDVLPFIRTQIEQDVKKEVLEGLLKENKIEYLDPSVDPSKLKAGK